MLHRTSHGTADSHQEDRLRRRAVLLTELGSPQAPKRITQRPFDYDSSHYQRLCAVASDEQPRAMALLNYALDLRYQSEVQLDLFRYLLPICLAAWEDNLAGRASYTGFVDEFYPALAQTRLWDQMLTPSAAAAVAEYMRGALLSVIDQQCRLSFSGEARGPHQWIAALASYGVLRPDLDLLWSAWWNVDTVGRAISCIQYASCLLYSESDHPVFAPWTPRSGGGPPVLWHYAGHLYDERWRPENLAFLERTLIAEYVCAKLSAAAARITSDPEATIARRVAQDAAQRDVILRSRCRELPERFQTRTDTASSLRWTS